MFELSADEDGLGVFLELRGRLSTRELSEFTDKVRVACSVLGEDWWCVVRLRGLVPLRDPGKLIELRSWMCCRGMSRMAVEVSSAPVRMQLVRCLEKGVFPSKGVRVIWGAGSGAAEAWAKRGEEPDVLFHRAESFLDVCGSEASPSPLGEGFAPGTVFA